ncbi:hypothetical protein [Polaribacter atrinae]|uniref:Uncharacterized protein n=1 Tax=Polaribacter atrinae TaxID=1333662 RepID=A0A176TBS5_9FLAO|nr:hypothetical protein [Polaribacter atrinae]OAD45209.1 hypothetical protein LPB303_08485 [Polaribacter atrinae]
MVIKQPNFKAINSNVIVVGYCGLPFYQPEKEQLWLNPEIIAIPANKGTPLVWHAILDDSKENFNFTR